MTTRHTTALAGNGARKPQTADQGAPLPQRRRENGGHDEYAVPDCRYQLGAPMEALSGGCFRMRSRNLPFARMRPATPRSSRSSMLRGCNPLPRKPSR